MNHNIYSNAGYCYNVGYYGDGHGDPCDNCPSVWNPGDLTTENRDQDDFDGDNVGDECDFNWDGDPEA